MPHIWLFTVMVQRIPCLRSTSSASFVRWNGQQRWWDCIGLLSAYLLSASSRFALCICGETTSVVWGEGVHAATMCHSLFTAEPWVPFAKHGVTAKQLDGTCRPRFTIMILRLFVARKAETSTVHT